MSYGTGYKIGNLIDQQRLASQGHMSPLGVQAQGNNRMMSYGLDNYNPIPMGAGGAPGMEGVVPAYGSDTPSFKPKPGMDIGTAAGIASYAPMIAGDVIQAFKAPDYDTSIETGDWSGYNIQHGLGDEIARSGALKQGQDNMITKSVVSNTAKFAATGASIGSVFPGFGTLIGAGAGALVGLGVGFFGGRRRKKKGSEQIASLDTGLANKMEQFSQANIKARTEQQQKRIALEQYNV
jgi:hypothetical protein